MLSNLRVKEEKGGEKKGGVAVREGQGWKSVLMF